MHLAGFASDEGFIRFDFARQLAERTSVQGKVNPVKLQVVDNCCAQIARSLESIASIGLDQRAFFLRA